jgi:precorrin-6B methylase 2
MNRSVDRDYVLGTHDEELERLGVQHRAWRPVVLECWEKAGITSGSRVLDVGAGPGYATLDLAGIVGPSGRVVAIERSHKFVSAIEQMIGSKSLHNIEVHEADLTLIRCPSARSILAGAAGSCALFPIPSC